MCDAEARLADRLTPLGWSGSPPTTQEWEWNVDKRAERNQLGQKQFSWRLYFMQRRQVSEEGVV